LAAVAGGGNAARAAGGGGVESSGGAIVAPNAYLDWQLDDWFTLRLGTGRIKSLGGAWTANLSMSPLNFLM